MEPKKKVPAVRLDNPKIIQPIHTFVKLALTRSHVC